MLQGPLAVMGGVLRCTVCDCDPVFNETEPSCGPCHMILSCPAAPSQNWGPGPSKAEKARHLCSACRSSASNSLDATLPTLLLCQSLRIVHQGLRNCVEPFQVFNLALQRRPASGSHSVFFARLVLHQPSDLCQGFDDRHSLDARLLQGLA